MKCFNFRAAIVAAEHGYRNSAGTYEVLIAALDYLKRRNKHRKQNKKIAQFKILLVLKYLCEYSCSRHTISQMKQIYETRA